jgi:diguanylate cyclase (GGDEF)-like protein
MAQDSYRSQLVEKRRQQLLEIVSGLQILPTTIGVPMRVLQLQRSGSASAADFSEALAADPGLCTKVLRLANSASFARSKATTKVSDAVAAIGLKNLLSLVFGLSIGGIFNKLSLPPAEKSLLWRASLLKAIAAREYALRRSPELAEEAFICGMVQDLALPVLYAADRSAWPELASILEMEDDARAERERAMNGIDHAKLGQLVAVQMGLPGLYQFATGNHHDGTQGLAALGNGRVAEALHLAAALPHRLTQVGKSAFARFCTRLPADRASGVVKPDPELLKAIVEKYNAMLGLLGESDESSSAFKQFLQAMGTEVAQCLEQAIIESNSTISSLKSRESELEGKIGTLKEQAIQSDYDALTKVLNRRGFVSRAARLLALAREYQAGVAMGFVDLDDFKSINDKLGHALGDAALQGVGARLSEAIRGRGLVGRLGGDEFAFMTISNAAGAHTPAVGDQVMAKEAERLMGALANLSISGAGGKRSLTTSIGLIWAGVPSPQQTVEEVVKGADELMYAAKRSGKAKCVFGHLTPSSATAPAAAQPEAPTPAPAAA